MGHAAIWFAAVFFQLVAVFASILTGYGLYDLKVSTDAIDRQAAALTCRLFFFVAVSMQAISFFILINAR